MFLWDDLRCLLAVARGGSTAAAARSLGMDATTVARRVAALEESVGLPLFERRANGYRSVAGLDLLAQAERVEAEMLAFEDLARANRRSVNGWVRVTGTEAMVTHLLGPAVARVREAHPGLRLEIVTEDRRMDLVRGAADIALRVGTTPHELSLVRQRMPDSCWSVYCSAQYAAAHGMPASLAELNHHQLIGGEGELARVRPIAWLERNAPEADIVCRCTTIGSVLAMLAAGAGVSVLPCIVGESHPNLKRCIAPPPELRNELWLLYHESQRHRPDVRAFVERLAAEVRLQRKRLDPVP